MFNPNQKINRQQKVLTAAQYKQLVANHENRAENAQPVVKLFHPFSPATWLLSELDPETGIAFGLCDLGFGTPEVGYVSLHEIMSLGVVNRDLHFKSDKTIMEWLDHANKHGLVGV